ncbi:MAG: ureidoglycolate lyase [Phormidium tanganyikae FI6-MK23]|jgi:ureidoglycolate hydrolase|nr:ureidoglycolate lyase [Phormidium tanganyikae FI6-MK23]
MQPSTIQQIQANLITAETFRPFGQVIQASSDGKSFDREDAQLHLENGIPHFYIMRLKHRGRKFHKITRHQQCTQCLGSLEGKEWLIVVAPPDNNESPAIADLTAFRIPGNCFIKLDIGTWHAGPYFDGDVVDFYNLELSDTNIVDHDTCDLRSTYAIEFEII